MEGKRARGMAEDHAMTALSHPLKIYKLRFHDSISSTRAAFKYAVCMRAPLNIIYVKTDPSLQLSSELSSRI